jgi:hypothetical protein
VSDVLQEDTCGRRQGGVGRPSPSAARCFGMHFLECGVLRRFGWFLEARRSKPKRRSTPHSKTVRVSRQDADLLRVIAEAVADAADGLDAVAGLAEFAAEGFDVDVDGALEDDGVFADGGVHELGAGEGAAGLAKQTFQEAKLRRRQLHLLALGQGQVT